MRGCPRCAARRNSRSEDSAQTVCAAKEKARIPANIPPAPAPQSAGTKEDILMITFGTGGWRAIIGDEFTRENVQRLAFALAQRMEADRKSVV